MSLKKVITKSMPVILGCCTSTWEWVRVRRVSYLVIWINFNEVVSLKQSELVVTHELISTIAEYIFTMLEVGVELLQQLTQLGSNL